MLLQARGGVLTTWAACLLAHRVHTAHVVAGLEEEPSHEAAAGAILEAESAWAAVQLRKDYVDTHQG